MGLVFILSLFIVPLGWFVFSRLVAKNLTFFHQQKFLTFGDIMEHYYGSTGRWLSSICSIALTLGVMAAGSMAIGTMFEYLFSIPRSTGMLVALGIVTIYSAFGGIQSVAFTDVFQFLIFFIALPVACAIGYHDAGGYKSIVAKLPESHLVVDIFSISSLSLIIYGLVPNTDIPYIQRALISKNPEQLRRTFNISALLMIPLFVIVGLIGLITYTHNTALSGDSVLFYFMKHHLPIGGVGMMTAGVLAIVMSTQDSFLNTTSTTIARDVCKQIWPSLTDRHQLLIARASCIVISAMAVTIIFLKDNILDLLWFISNFWDPLISMPFLVAMMGMRIKKKLFIFAPISVLIAETITRVITGEFGIVSFAVGIITSLAALCIINLLGKKLVYKPLSVFAFNIKKRYQELVLVMNSSPLKLLSAYTFSILVIFGFCLSGFFNPLEGSISKDSVLYLHAVAASLCVLFLLSDLWLSNKNETMLKYFWYFILFFCLPFFSMYICARSAFYWTWIMNFILSTVLLYFLAPASVFIITLIPGIILGAVFGILSNIYFQSKIGLHVEFDVNFAIYSCASMVLMIVLIIHDKIYVQKQLYTIVEREVVDRTKDLRTALEVKQEFLDNVSHEIKTPIHNITNIISELHDQWERFSDECKKDLVLNPKESNHRLLELCSNLLDFSKFTKGEEALDKEKHDITNIVDDFLQEFRGSKNLISVSISKNLRRFTYCDKGRFLQVLRNLVSNAIKYGKGSRIQISLSNFDKDHIKFAISDEGVGIPKSELESIFNPFEQSSKTKTRAGGSGLGLAIAKKIVEMHYGRVWARNNKAGGATFFLVIPNEKH